VDCEGSGHPLEDIGLEEILALRSWSVAAKFRIGSAEAIYKCNRLPLYSRSGTIHAILAERMPHAVPQLIGYRDEEGFSWTLCWWASGTSLEDCGRSDLFYAAAETMAEIQMAFTEVADERVASLPRYWETSQIPAMLETLIERIESYYADHWARAGGARLRRRSSDRLLSVPDDFGARLARHLPSVQRWVSVLTDGKWTDTIVHVDLHPENVIVESGGGIRILDWDQAAIGFPFDAVMWLDIISREERWGSSPTASGSSVKEAYLETLTWNTMQERLTAWETYSRVARIVSAYEAEVRSDALQRSQRDGGSVAMLLMNCLRDWESPREQTN